MKVTRICQIYDKEHVDSPLLERLMAVFCNAMRFSFNRLLEGDQSSDLIKQVNRLFRLNKRYAEDAVLQAQAIIASQKVCAFRFAFLTNTSTRS